LSQRVSEVIAALHALRRERSADQGAWWASFCRLVRELCVADEAAVLHRNAEHVAVWAHSVAPSAVPVLESASIVEGWLPGLLKRASERGLAISPHGDPTAPGARVALPLSGRDDLWLVLLLAPAQLERANELLLRARLVADLGMEADAGGEARPVVSAEVLQLIAEVQTQKRFQTAALALVNGLVRHNPGIDLALLGWRDSAYVKVQALSHFDRFERRTEWIRLLEAAQEEAADQDRSIVFPVETGASGVLVLQAHRQLLAHSGAKGILTIPLGTMDERGELVLTVLAYGQPPDESLRTSLHLLLELLFPFLARLKQEAMPWPKRVYLRARGGVGWLLGSESLGWKLAGLIVSAGLVYGLFGSLPHRVEGRAMLVTDEVRVLSAPFDGKVDRALVRPGDEVSKGDVLALMDTEDLLLERGELQADLQRQTAEVLRARARGNLVEAEIAEARAQQARARLARIELRIGRAELRSDLSGIVVDGDPSSLVRRPINQGAELYRLARIESMYLRIAVPQEDIHFVELGDTGRFVFLSRPDDALPIQVSRIIPMARVEEGVGAVFDVLAEIDAKAAHWWRPGMEGVARIDQGERSVFWVLGHRLVNRLRIWLWW